MSVCVLKYVCFIRTFLYVFLIVVSWGPLGPSTPLLEWSPNKKYFIGRLVYVKVHIPSYKYRPRSLVRVFLYFVFTLSSVLTKNICTNFSFHVFVLEV